MKKNSLFDIAFKSSVQVCCRFNYSKMQESYYIKIGYYILIQTEAHQTQGLHFSFNKHSPNLPKVLQIEIGYIACSS